MCVCMRVCVCMPVFGIHTHVYACVWVTTQKHSKHKITCLSTMSDSGRILWPVSPIE